MSTESHDSYSAELFSRAQKVLPGGVSRNAVFRRPHPFYADFGEGCYLTDLEGVQRIDFANNMASLIHGHANAEIAAAVSEQMKKGTAFNIATEVEIDYAEQLCARSSAFEKIRFVNSGTEAVMTALKVARAFTGKEKIAKVEGAYHGAYDYAEVSQTAKPENWGDANSPASVPVAQGTPQAALNDVVIIPFNDPVRAIEILDKQAGDIACVLVDPLPHRVGLTPAQSDYVDALYKWTRKNNALLVFDEVITFRSNYGGAQAWYDVKPDLTALGKMIGGGFPVGALTGRTDVMAVLDPMQAKVLLPHSGTYSANPITMTAGKVAMQLFNQDAVTKLNALSEKARTYIADAIKTADIPICVSGAGSMFRVHFKETPPQDYRAAYMDAKETAMLKILLDHCFDHGIILINSGAGTLSTPMTEKDITQLAEVLLAGFRKIKDQF